ncbi:acyl-CoA synthetase (AMP-forming)/AMP-acid ligase II [Desulfitobacterium dichloroeliminans LMG P-21439]|uniref:Acyl-CoA synthetase (AMP-forming)/AMP-acid ligase II n=1 Tax=Desulfitobacterium dichloroeliminans (strain LMG P-21439 / DCA1) TaxID=871963 RepID=L0FD78_DESDL|nr:AMP-binding protein [Desulfitobacterium dichloroeliminans]AGA70591.1 acyl-CoA synthetase (AMP-forming)/AMP-acid ligase II [Desulfitobacterium dichloroeliminans LMG P-21439]
MAFYDMLKSFGETTALISEQDCLSYAQLQNEVCKLQEQINERCLVFCVCNNNVESITGYIAFLQMRVVPVLINHGINTELFKNLLYNYEPHYVWAPKGFCAGIICYEYKNYALFKTEYQQEVEINLDLALLLTTSGSTGSPKLVRQSYCNINSNAESIAQYLNISGEDRPITTLPMSYTYGLSIINSHLLRGASIILTDATLMEKSFWKLLKEKCATTFGGVPYTYEILKKLRFSKMNLPDLKVLTQAGGKLGKERHLEFATACSEKGIDFVVMYGQTEATARMSYVPREYAISKAGSIGIAIPGGEFWLEDENGGTITEPNIVGELVYHGDNVTMGYATCKEDLAKEDGNGGVLKTGDMAMKDTDGFYYIVGRKKRFLKIFGNRVNLDEIESLLKKHGFIVACTGKDDLMKIYLENGQPDTVFKLIANLTGLNRSAFEVCKAEKIPRNEAGKILYAELR